jgi:hypothetical protein
MQGVSSLLSARLASASLHSGITAGRQKEALPGSQDAICAAVVTDFVPHGRFSHFPFCPVFVAFEFLTAVTMKGTIFWNVTPCSPIEVYDRFGVRYSCVRGTFIRNVCGLIPDLTVSHSKDGLFSSCFGSVSLSFISLWLFLFLVFLFAAQPKEFFLDGLKKLEQRSHKCVELRGGICYVM